MATARLNRQAVDVPGFDQVETTTAGVVVFRQFRDFVFATGQHIRTHQALQQGQKSGPVQCRFVYPLYI